MTQEAYNTIEIKQRKTNSNATENPDLLTLQKQEVLRFSQDTKHRKILVYWMMWTVGIWLGVTLIITIFSSFLYIDVRVICVLLATTTINVLGLSKIILNGMFTQ